MPSADDQSERDTQWPGYTCLLTPEPTVRETHHIVTYGDVRPRLLNLLLPRFTPLGVKNTYRFFGTT